MTTSEVIRDRLEKIARAKLRKCPICNRTIPLTDAELFYRHSSGSVKCPQSGKKFKSNAKGNQ